MEFCVFVCLDIFNEQKRDKSDFDASRVVPTLFFIVRSSNSDREER